MNIRPAESDVKKFLRVALRQRARAVVSLEVKTRAAGLLSEDQHITDARVFKRAKKSLGIKSMRAGFGARSHWLWQLPRLNQEAHRAPQGVAGPTAVTGPNPGCSRRGRQAFEVR
jgi:hypothetical protein